MRPTVLLFDIDGTLVDTAGAGRRAFELAFEGLHGRKDGLAGIALCGMTDPAIARRALQQAGLPDSEAAMEALLAEYVRLLPIELARTAASRALAGVPELLARLLSVGGVGVGLGTGNLRQGALAKLESAGLGGLFRFGGFGSDHEQRAEILRLGAERGAAYLQTGCALCRVVVIGDTPRDVAAGKAIGAECLAVASGTFDCAALAATGADRVVADLSDAAVVAMLLDGRG